MEELSTLSRGCGRQSGQGRGRKALQDDSTVGKKKAAKSNIDMKSVDLFITNLYGYGDVCGKIVSFIWSYFTIEIRKKVKEDSYL